MKGKWAAMAAVASMTALTALLCDCTGNNAQVSSRAETGVTDSIRLDSILELEDTFALDDESNHETMTVWANETFDDFIFRFDQSARLQRQRVRFPLPAGIDADGEHHIIERRDWRHHTLFMGQDFYTVLWNRRSQMELAADSNVNEAHVEQIYLHSRTMNVYTFERDSAEGRWMLTQIEAIPFEHSKVQGFLDFYREFATDSVFQRHHVRSQIRYTTYDEDDEYAAVSGTIDADQWFEFAPELPQDVITNVNYGQAYPNPNRMIMQMRGLANGLQTLMIFHRDLSGNWMLTDYEN